MKSGGPRRVRGARPRAGVAVERPPHYERIRALLGALDAPVVELWGWPGTGKRAILAALLDDEPDVRHLPAAWLGAPERLEERLSRAVGRRPALLVCEETGDAAEIERVSSWLRPGQRLVVAVERRLGLGRGVLATAVEDLLLRADEIDTFWRATTGRALSTGEQEQLARRSDGWWFLLNLWARDPPSANASIDDEDSFGFDCIADFLRERVLVAMSADEIGVARELARRGAVQWRGGVEGRETALRSLVECSGLARIRDGELHLPRALAACLLDDSGLRLSAPEPEQRDDGPLAAPATILDANAAAVAAPVIPIHRNWRDERERVAADVRIGLLGVPRVERRDSSGALVPVVWSFKRPLRILAYLASAPDLQATREEIVSILWPESSEDAISRNLHPAVSWLRRSVWPGNRAGRPKTGAMRGVVLLRDGVYSLDPTLHWEVDVRLFLERIEDGARHLARGRTGEAEASWEAAWRLYQGAFVQGWSERWVLAQRDELQLRFTDLLRRLGDLKAQLGRLAEAEDAYRTLLIEDPLEEGIHVAIMRIYGARGRRDLVNRQYERLRQVLRQELGVDPSPPTLEVFNDLMLSPAPRR